MKCKVEDIGFKPVKLSLTFESLAELVSLRESLKSETHSTALYGVINNLIEENQLAKAN